MGDFSFKWLTGSRPLTKLEPTLDRRRRKWQSINWKGQIVKPKSITALSAATSFHLVDQTVNFAAGTARTGITIR